MTEQIERSKVYSRPELAQLLGLTYSYLNSPQCRIKPDLRGDNGRVYYLKTKIEEYLKRKNKINVVKIIDEK